MSRFTFGFDIDGVLTNDDDGECSIWLREAAEYFGEPLPQKRAYYIEDAFNKSTEEVQGFFSARMESILDRVPIREHATDTLRNLLEGGHTVHLITARDEKIRQTTERWLKRHDVPYHTLFMSPTNGSYSKGTLCKELQVGFFVDDKVENVLDTSGKGIYTLLFHASHNLEHQTSLPLVKNWLEVQEHIDKFLRNAAL